MHLSTKALPVQNEPMVPTFFLIFLQWSQIADPDTASSLAAIMCRLLGAVLCLYRSFCSDLIHNEKFFFFDLWECFWEHSNGIFNRVKHIIPSLILHLFTFLPIIFRVFVNACRLLGHQGTDLMIRRHLFLGILVLTSEYFTQWKVVF